MFSDKRRMPRFNLVHRVDIQFGSRTAGGAEGLNLSESGLLCRTPEPIGLYAEVDLHLRLGSRDGGELACRGTVVRVERQPEGFLSGITFTSTPDGFQSRLKSFLADLPGQLRQ